MSIFNKLGLSFASLLMISLVCAVISILSANSASFHLNRANLAHQSYQAHLRLSSQTLKLFNDFESIALPLQEQKAEQIKERIQAINSDIEFIRKVISDEILMVGEEEVEELEELGAMERLIHSVISRYTILSESENRADKNEALLRLNQFLNSDIGLKIENAISEALAEETNEIEETREESEATLNATKATALGFGVGALVIGLLAFLLTQKQILVPLRNIIIGAQKFAGGNYGHHIDLKVGGELGEIADAVNAGAVLAHKRQQKLEDSNLELQEAVDQQTEELRLTILNLENQRRMRQRLLADVSHELKTPLTVIQGEADIALRGNDKELAVYKEALMRASEAAKHTSQLVDDVLFIGRQELNQASLDLKQQDILPIIETMIDTLQSLFERSNANITLHSHAKNTVVSIDEKRIKQVLIILLENACHYGGKNITLNVLQSPDGLVISVNDDGPGIEPVEIEHIFDRFFRGNNAAERYGSGAGLGLPVAKSIIETHKGTLSVESELTKGTEFKVVLPSRGTLKAVS